MSGGPPSNIGARHQHLVSPVAAQQQQGIVFGGLGGVFPGTTAGAQFSQPQRPNSSTSPAAAAVHQQAAAAAAAFVNQLGMGSLQNLSRRGERVTPTTTNSGDFGSGGRLTPNSLVAAFSSGGGVFSQPPPSFHPQESKSNNFFGNMNLMPSSSSSPASAPPLSTPGRNPLFNRERKLGDSILSPNTFDPTEFPSLGQNSAPNPSLSARPNYVGMVKQPAMESSEFTMSHEDFPALPGSSSSSSATPAGGGPTAAAAGAMEQQQQAMNDRMTSQGLHQDCAPNMGVAQSVSQTVHYDDGSGSAVAVATGAKKGIQTTADGTVKNIPNSMVRDQFGMIGLLTFIRAAETDPNLVSLALGADLTTLGLNLNSEVNLYPTFGGPWADTPCRPQDIDFHVPHEYLTNQAIRDKLAPVKLNRYKDDVLFYMFYTNVGDVLQLAAAAELYNRDWRYHREDRVWITRAPGMAPSEKTNTYERGTYYFFDVASWRKVPKDFHLDYHLLEDRPALPQNLGGGGQAAAASNSGTQMPTPSTSAADLTKPPGSGAAGP